MRENGITLVALVITIVILLILAGISISALTNTGIFGKVKEAKNASENADKEQSQISSGYERELSKYLAKELTDDKINTVLSKTENTILKDANGNFFTLPAGFKVVVSDDTNNAKTVDKGIVIEDETDAATKGSQFVWVPVGNIIKTDGTTVEINLDRYVFDGEGNEISLGDKIIGTFQELEISDKGNAVAKSLTNFKNSVTINGGYYIGRFEARTSKERNSSEDKLEQITEKGTDFVYNYVTQLQASSQAQNMYINDKFVSDLMNSYAWDTATLFLQSCGLDKYSIKTCVNSSHASKGTNSQDYIGTRDNVCNIYDMTSNIAEWETETCSYPGTPCAFRGGFYSFMNRYTNTRSTVETKKSVVDLGFRPILYINI